MMYSKHFHPIKQQLKHRTALTLTHAWHISEQNKFMDFIYSIPVYELSYTRILPLCRATRHMPTTFPILSAPLLRHFSPKQLLEPAAHTCRSHQNNGPRTNVHCSLEHIYACACLSRCNCNMVEKCFLYSGPVCLWCFESAIHMHSLNAIVMADFVGVQIRKTQNNNNDNSNNGVKSEISWAIHTHTHKHTLSAYFLTLFTLLRVHKLALTHCIFCINVFSSSHIHTWWLGAYFSSFSITSTCLALETFLAPTEATYSMSLEKCGGDGKISLNFSANHWKMSMLNSTACHAIDKIEHVANISDGSMHKRLNMIREGMNKSERVCACVWEIRWFKRMVNSLNCLSSFLFKLFTGFPWNSEKFLKNNNSKHNLLTE